MNIVKHTVIGSVVFLLTVFIISSCTVRVNQEGSNPDNQNFMNFTLTRGGTEIDINGPLVHGSTYRLTVEVGSDASITTADYNITHQPPDAFIINDQGPNFISFTVNTAVNLTAVTVTAVHKQDNSITESLRLSLKNPDTSVTTPFSQDIQGGTVPNLTTVAKVTRDVLEPLKTVAGATLEKRYATESGAGSQDGSSWANAWAATNLRNGINAISDASANKVYLVMVAGGTYKPTYASTVDRTISFFMKSYVAIMGGFQVEGGWERTGTTIFSGDIGIAGNPVDNNYHVFRSDLTRITNAHLYEVVITGGNANGTSGSVQARGGGMYNSSQAFPTITRVLFTNNNAESGGGMYNDSLSLPIISETLFSGNTTSLGGAGMFNNNSSPVIIDTVFRGNRAGVGTGAGGGMFNELSSPVLTRVVFSENTATDSGGGMLNDSSSPVLTEVVFSGNTATGGGGMYNRDSSSPVMIGAVFSGNTATGTSGGGGMFSDGSSPVMIGAVFRNNTAANGGGILNDNDGEAGPLIVNSIFSGNTLSGSGSGPDIAVNRDNSGAVENIRIAGSVLGLGPPPSTQPTNAIVGYNGTAALNISNHSLANGVVNFGADANLTVNGLSFPYPTIAAGSSAINLGLFVRKNGGTYYFSETGTGTSWHTGFTSAGGLDGTAEDLPTTGTTEDLTATDFAGNARNGRPDAGVHELP